MDHYLTEEMLSLHLIASGLMQLAKKKQLSAPYPAPLQRGFDRVCAAALRENQEPPQNILVLLDWCQTRPLARWPLPMEFREVYANDLLLEAGRPTAQCEELAVVAASNVEDEVVENSVMLGAMKICREATHAALYVAFRRLLIEKPVLTPKQFLLESAKMRELRDILERAYQIAGAAYRHDGGYIACKRCGSLLIRDSKGALCCEDSLCRREGETKMGREWSEEVLQLRSGLRRFVARPGRAELSLFKKLKKRGYAVELWPDFDAYDLKITLPDEVWVVDVKDWANPFLLAHSINNKGAFQQSAEAPWTRAFWVFPNARHKQSRYMEAFENKCRQLGDNVRAVFESGLLKELPR